MGRGERRMAKGILGKIGSWAFLIGIVIAGLLGLYAAVEFEGGNLDFFAEDMGGWLSWLLAVLGVIVGILAFLGKGTVTRKETPGFLLAAIGLVVMAGVFQQNFAGVIKPYIGSLLAGISMTMAIFVAPTVGLLAIRSIWDMGKD
jgi:hypothetical protein